MNYTTRRAIDGSRRWEEQQAPDNLSARLGFARSVIGIPHWRLEGSPNHSRKGRSAEVSQLDRRGIIRRGLGALRRRLRAAAQSRAGMHALSRLDDHLLRDAGFHRGQIERLQNGSASLRQIEAERFACEVGSLQRLPSRDVPAVVQYPADRDCANDCEVRQAA